MSTQEAINLLDQLDTEIESDRKTWRRTSKAQKAREFRKLWRDEMVQLDEELGSSSVIWEFRKLWRRTSKAQKAMHYIGSHVLAARAA